MTFRCNRSTGPFPTTADDGYVLCYDCVGICTNCDGAAKVDGKLCSVCSGRRYCLFCKGTGQVRPQYFPGSSRGELVARSADECRLERGSLRRALGSILGLAVGDALGTTNEFKALTAPPFAELATGPLDDVVGGGPFKLAAGEVTDDTQMAAALAELCAVFLFACNRNDSRSLAAVRDKAVADVITAALQADPKQRPPSNVISSVIVAVEASRAREST